MIHGPGVVGTGIDLVHVPGFEEQLARPGTRMLEEVFTAAERRDCDGRAESLAARWAAKEAFIKAWSVSMWGQPPVLHEQIHHLIEVVTDAWGRPRLVLHGEVAEECKLLTAQVSLSHDADLAIAHVLLMRS